MFRCLIWFPCLFLDNRESDSGNEEMVESVKEEKRRKQMEAIAEDLFNNEKVCKTSFLNKSEEICLVPHIINQIFREGAVELQVLFTGFSLMAHKSEQLAHGRKQKG